MSDKPAPHPAPWRWDSSPGSIVATTALLDAAGDPVLKAFANPLIPLLAFVHVEPAARAVIESAGEMEALLREGMKGVDLCHFQNLRRLQGQPIGEPCMTCWACKVLPVLARLDAAKGGRDEPLTPEEMQGRAYTVEELRMRTPVVIATRSRFETPLDADACGPCKARHGAAFTPGDPIDHPGCENPNGCRCVIVMTAE